MKQTIKHSMFFFLVAILLQSCTGCNRVQPNFEGVLMQNYGRNGIADFKLVTGSQGILGPGTELYQVPMYEQKGDPAQVTITAKDAGQFTVDPFYTYQPLRSKGVNIIFNYKHLGVSDELTMMDNIENNILNTLIIDTYKEEARNYTTDSLMTNLNQFENAVESKLRPKFEAKFFQINSLTSGLTPPASMSAAIERRNNAIQEAEQVKNELQTSKMRLEKAKIDAETNNVTSQGLTKEILTQQWIEAIKATSNKVIITDGKLPLLLQ